MASAPNFFVLVIGRFIVGLGVGSASMNMPIIISEMAEPSIRGLLVTCINVAITGGQFISCLIAGSLSKTPQGWRYMLGIAAIPAIIQFIGFLFMPESPRWLIEKDQVDRATAVLQLIRGREDVYEELEDIVASIEADRSTMISNGLGGQYRADTAAGGTNKMSLSQQLQSKNIRRALFIGCCLQAGQQLGGINTVM
jgi:MFS transporter, SP family, solute carrier family 2 (myo-inositol transporter), member 13